MKTSLALTILFLTSMLYGQEYLTDVSVTSGAKFNSSVTNEKFSDFFGEDRYERNVYHTSSWNCKPFVAIQTSLIELELKKQKKGRSLSLKLEAGLLYNQVYRDHHFGFLYIQPVDADTTLYHIYDSDYPLDYSTRSNNLGFRLGVIFIKKWSRIFDFEYGLTYRINYAFLNRTTYHHLPSNESWRELKYPKSMYRKSLINQEVHYYLGAIFKLNKRLSIGLSTEVPSLMFGYLKYRNQYPIPGEVNNFMNRNLFLGLKCAYRLK